MMSYKTHPVSTAVPSYGAFVDLNNNTLPIQEINNISLLRNCSQGQSNWCLPKDSCQERYSETFATCTLIFINKSVIYSGISQITFMMVSPTNNTDVVYENEEKVQKKLFLKTGTKSIYQYHFCKIQDKENSFQNIK